MACAVVAAAFPAVALWLRTGSAAAVAFALGGSAIAIVLLAALVRPLAAVARGLGDCLADDPPALRPAGDPRGAGGMVGAVAEVSARIDGMRQRLTNRHPVTGLPTREPFLAELMNDVQVVEGAVVLGVVRFSDYDRLAAFDQAAADRALRAFAVRLRSSAPTARPVAQVDRDCFAIWFKGARDQQAAAQELKALSYVLAQELEAGELKLTPNIAMGAAVFPQDGAVPGELLTRAIAALEIGPQGGKMVAFFSAQGSAAARERFSLEQDLRGAVSRDELLLHYQPVVDTEAGKVVGAEALLRWRHPTLGLIAPSRFIPILEQSPMMAEVGLWVLNAACREVCAWRRQGLDDLKIAVNLSTTQCRDPRLNEMVMRTLERHGLPSSSLELELTETAAMEDADHIRRLLGELCAQGVSVAIDDFGSGYSSLSYLKNLPFSKLKIDREFVTDVGSRRDSRAICATLIALGHGLDISVLAEGVETLEEVETLRAMGCRLFQGYFFARPMDAAAFASTVRDRSWLARLATPRPTCLRALEATR
ncbi:MAG TPA: bifunctional diguanylate cyclase/phosphodiesterase [Caulobacteraceae bacterium]|nr:bifunctional diguanylate cyclase/phosphodiesterase [Caulobacteraceae bacterium]